MHQKYGQTPSINSILIFNFLLIFLFSIFKTASLNFSNHHFNFEKENWAFNDSLRITKSDSSLMWSFKCSVHKQEKENIKNSRLLEWKMSWKNCQNNECRRSGICRQFFQIYNHRWRYFRPLSSQYSSSTRNQGL